MANVEISVLSLIPDEIPGRILGSARLVGQVGNDLNVRAEDNLSCWIRLFNERDQASRLWIIDQNHIRLLKDRLKEGSIFCAPRIVESHILACQDRIRMSHSL